MMLLDSSLQCCIYMSAYTVSHLQGVSKIVFLHVQHLHRYLYGFMTCAVYIYGNISSIESSNLAPYS